jgi:hypothetical protein
MLKVKTPREELQPHIDFALVELGWTEDQFLRLTPERWQQILDAWLNRERRSDRRTARICATIANCFGNNTSEEDFMPQQQDDTVMSIDEMFVALGGDLPNGK